MYVPAHETYWLGQKVKVGGITVDGSPSSSIYTVSQKVDHPTDGDNFVKT